MLVHDPVEDTPAYRAVEVQVDADAEAAVAAAGIARTDGWCHAFWDAKQRILQERHGLAWRSPRQMNPGVVFD